VKCLECRVEGGVMGGLLFPSSVVIPVELPGLPSDFDYLNSRNNGQTIKLGPHWNQFKIESSETPGQRKTGSHPIILQTRCEGPLKLEWDYEKKDCIQITSITCSKCNLKFIYGNPNDLSNKGKLIIYADDEWENLNEFYLDIARWIFTGARGPTSKTVNSTFIHVTRYDKLVGDFISCLDTKNNIHSKHDDVCPHLILGLIPGPNLSAHVPEACDLIIEEIKQTTLECSNQIKEILGY
jgi:hypothetical protein